MNKDAKVLKTKIANWILIFGCIGLFTLNWNEYTWMKAFEKYNAWLLAIVLIAVFGLYFEKDDLKRNWILYSIVSISILSVLLLRIASKDASVCIVLFDFLLLLYLTKRIESKKNGIYGLIAVAVFVASFFIYWTIDIKGYFKGYSINYGGLVLLSGLIFFIAILEYLKHLVLNGNDNIAVVAFFKKYRFYLTYIELVVFFWGYKIIAYYRSRTAFVAMIVFAIYVFLPKRFVENKIVYWLSVIGTVLGGILFPFVYVCIGNNVDKTVYKFLTKQVFSDRMDVWPQLLTVFKSFPLTGIGTLYLENANPYRDGILDTCNAYVDLFVVYGGVVAVATLALLATVLLSFRKCIVKSELAKVLFGGIIAMLVASYTESYFITVPFMAVFMIGLICVKVCGENEKFQYDDDYIGYYKGLYHSKFGKKFLYVFIPLYAICFMYFVFGPVEIFYSNSDEFIFNFKTFFWIFFVVSALGCIVISSIIATLNDRVGIVIASLATAWGVASYVQYLFFNVVLIDEFGVFANANTIGSKYYVSLVAYALILLAGIFLGIWKKSRDYFVKYVPLFLLAIQLVAFLSILVNLRTIERKGQYIRMIDTTTQFEVAKGNNIFVFVLDSFDREYFEQIEEEFPDKTEFLNDFTYYINTDSVYYPTFPSLPHMLTDKEYSDDMRRRDYEKGAFTDEATVDYYAGLRERGYKTKLYSTDIIRSNYLDNILDNLKLVQKDDSYDAIISVLSRQSAYRYMPYCLKPYFEWRIDEPSGTFVCEGMEKFYKNSKAYNYVKENGFHINEDLDNLISISHYHGAHSYPNNDEECREVEINSVPEYVCGAGSLKMTKLFVDELKRLDKYDDSSIIVMGDHGASYNPTGPIFFVKRPYETGSEYRINNEEFKYCQFMDLIEELAE